MSSKTNGLRVFKRITAFTRCSGAPKKLVSALATSPRAFVAEASMKSRA
ncbi:MAG: hypothetical protein WA417_25810 [Stellaceae bacterium]